MKTNWIIKSKINNLLEIRPTNLCDKLTLKKLKNIDFLENSSCFELENFGEIKNNIIDKCSKNYENLSKNILEIISSLYNEYLAKFNKTNDLNFKVQEPSKEENWEYDFNEKANLIFNYKNILKIREKWN
ncbi:unknown; predicted coding region [Mycoplasmopsis pulmonis]|uniref:Uncharacterized protein n=1 Tax=Mycoplasmopsis pulmonis (strain UAB CTIP) TaxID=272635 RepID=Q98R75_MYCPU|nr:hypothetical protein [Mycoplasmopsis pulmonis]MDZ7293104.1 hypothetical protein [Mycoplasmopsis pulmonis]CAC13308.1 unknown; predicted coding region [Mycoplasmopsis pulmonis]VEU67899.1 Uncharacterised protein [Mycoplasmopsis pulmonis]